MPPSLGANQRKIPRHHCRKPKIGHHNDSRVPAQRYQDENHRQYFRNHQRGHGADTHQVRNEEAGFTGTKVKANQRREHVEDLQENENAQGRTLHQKLHLSIVSRHDHARPVVFG